MQLRALILGIAGSLLLFGCTPAADTTPPAVQITQPSNNTTVNTDRVTLKGTATDNRGVTRATYQLNGGPEQPLTVSAGPSVNLDTSVANLAIGNNVITVNAYDAAGNKGSATVSVKYQPGAPSISISQPANGSTVNTASVNVQGTASDDVSVTKLTYQLNGGDEQQVSITAGASVNFSFSVANLPEGNNVITVNAYDALNNKASATVRLSYTPGAPSVTITRPSNSSTSGSASLVVEGTATDDVGVTRLTYQLNGGTEQEVSITPAASVDFSFTVSSLSVGNNFITVNAYDALGKKGSAVVNLTYSPGAPTVTLLQPVNNQSVNTASIQVQGTATDGQQVTRVTYSLNGGAEQEVSITAAASVNLDFAVNGLSQGNNVITVYAYNALNLKAAATVAVVYQPAAPGVTITQPANNLTTNNASLTVAGTATDDQQVTRLTYQLNGGPEQAVTITPGASVNFSFSVSSLREGSNTITVNAYDALDLKGSATVTVVFGSLSLSGIVVDNNAGAAVAGSVVSVDGSPATAVTDADGAFTLYLPAGTYNLNFRKAGHAGSRLEGLRLQANLGPISVIQKRAANPDLSTTPPTLSVTTGAGGCPSIAAGEDFASVTQAQDCIPFRIVASAQGSGNMMRLIYAALGKTPGSGTLTNPRFSWPADTNGPDTGNRNLSGSSVAGISGPTTFEVVAYDVNENRVHRIYYLDFSQTLSNPSVTPVSNFSVLSITLGQAIGFYGAPKPTTVRIPGTAGVSIQGAPNSDSTLWVQLSWSYGNTNPNSFEVWRSFDGNNFVKIATLGGGARSFNDASPQLAVGKRAYYRVDAVGSDVAQGPVLATTPLDRFTVSLLSPAKNQTGVSVQPTLSWSVSQKVGDLRLFAPFILDYPQQGDYLIWAPGLNNPRLLYDDNTLAVNGNTYSVSYNQDGSAGLSRLEAFHAYSFDLSAAAVSFDPADPTRTEAISIAQDLWNIFHSLGTCNFGGPVCTGEWNEFVTGDGSY